jgi:hypothetical protein
VCSRQPERPPAHHLPTWLLWDGRDFLGSEWDVSHQMREDLADC